MPANSIKIPRSMKRSTGFTWIQRTNYFGENEMYTMLARAVFTPVYFFISHVCELAFNKWKSHGRYLQIAGVDCRRRRKRAREYPRPSSRLILSLRRVIETVGIHSVVDKNSRSLALSRNRTWMHARCTSSPSTAASFLTSVSFLTCINSNVTAPAFLVHVSLHFLKKNFCLAVTRSLFAI